MVAEPSAGRSGPPAVGPVRAGAPGRGGPTPVLLDGSVEGRLPPRLIDRLGDPDLDRIDMAVSFVMKSGLARILGPLEDALDRGARVRVLTTDYLAITDPDALTQLADLAEGGDRLRGQFEPPYRYFDPLVVVWWATQLAGVGPLTRSAGRSSCYASNRLATGEPDAGHAIGNH